MPMGEEKKKKNGSCAMTNIVRYSIAARVSSLMFKQEKKSNRTSTLWGVEAT